MIKKGSTSICIICSKKTDKNNLGDMSINNTLSASGSNAAYSSKSWVTQQSRTATIEWSCNFIRKAFKWSKQTWYWISKFMLQKNKHVKITLYSCEKEVQTTRGTLQLWNEIGWNKGQAPKQKRGVNHNSSCKSIKICYIFWL